MLTQSQVEAARARAAEMLAKVGIAVTAGERESIEVADFGLGELDATGLELITYVNNERYCAKELILFPRQTCPEHRHPPVEGKPGKQETFRCRWGHVFLYTQGAPARERRAVPPPGSEAHYTVFHEIALGPGDQFTIPSNVKHWFQAGDEGAIVSEFSSASRDDLDVFTDPRIARATEIRDA